ncbi:MAG: hypothetical protein IT359_12840 [Gemmatimonadaceae bacterium]|nr:hypothetical protein [Gemmatimonadaceae bacterium]
MSMSSRRRHAALATAALLLTACQDATSPANGAFDAPRLVAGVTAVEKVAASSAIGSLTQLARYGGGSAVGASVAAARVASGGDARWSVGLADAVSRLATRALDAGSALIPVMRSNALGKVYVYDATLGRYVASARSGAPSNGARFILYAESSSGVPITGQETGYADLTDEKRASAGVAGVKLVVVLGGVTRVSYAFDLAIAGGTPNFSLQGFLVDGADRLDFTVDATSALLGNGTATVKARLAAPQQGFTVNATIKGRPDSRDGEIDLTIASASDEVVVDAATVNNTLVATFTVNGTLLANAKGNPESPEITGANGRTLNADELRALQKIVEMAGAVFDLVQKLVEPAGAILLVALGLGLGA